MIEKMKAAWRGALRRRALQADYRILQAMDERLLLDIGVTRGDIDSAVARLRFRV